MKTTERNWENLLDDPKRLIEEGYKWAVVYHYDALTYSTVEEMVIYPEYLIEARIFSETQELILYKDNQELKAVEKKEDSKECIETFYLLDGSCEYRKLGVKKYINYDEEDHQAYIEYVRPFKLIGGDA